jgi:hypothetical protein
MANEGTLFLDEIGDLSISRKPSCCACSRNGASSGSAATIHSRRLPPDFGNQSAARPVRA